MLFLISIVFLLSIGLAFAIVWWFLIEVLPLLLLLYLLLLAFRWFCAREE